MNIYVEEVPASAEEDNKHDVQDAQMLREYDTIEEAQAAEAHLAQTRAENCEKPARDNCDVDASRKVSLQGGGELQDLKFETCSLGDPSQWMAQERLRIMPTSIQTASTSTRTPGPAARGGAQLVRLGDDVVLFGGASRDGTHYGDLWKLAVSGNGAKDASAVSKKRPNAWTDLSKSIKGSAPAPRCGHAATAQGDARMVIFGGLDASCGHVFNDVHILTKTICSKTGKDEWTWHAPTLVGVPPTPRTETCAVGLGNKIIYFGGSSPHSGVFRDMHVLHLDASSQTGRWSTVRCEGRCPLARELAACVLLQPTAPHSTNNDADADVNLQNARALQHYGEYLMTDAVLAQATRPENKQVPSAEAQSRANDLRNKGNRKYVSGELDAAHELYAKGIEADGSDARLFGNRSAVRLALDDPQGALQDALAAVRLDSQWGKAYYREAMALIALERYQEAVAPLQSAVELASSEKERDGMLRASHELQRDHLAQGPDAENLTPVFPHNQDLVLCVHGGKGADGVLRDLQFFDLHSARWFSPAQETPFPRCGHTMWKANDRLFVFGGWDGGVHVSGEVQSVDPLTGMWSECAMATESQVAARFSHASCSVASEALVFGGVSFQSDLADVLEFRVGDDSTREELSA
ncbi:Kelch domain-containing protein 1 [Hondaea fermentalgiana]|uniref:Kelch domain-containing protein 1 n=1 Tax=Hondaea fermentalgiana TaxID=2315210 RepID=A0A2R5GKC9_9STRA|nr:Kelch domain-containing protein 1 [Hondaea fermentalgiana]|eukprot:GBG31337.1 Kelch domain-containing protein 1 [Hondaea fermentalgiana]